MKKIILLIVSFLFFNSVFASDNILNKFDYKSEDKTLSVWFERIVKLENTENQFKMDGDIEIINEEKFKKIVNDNKKDFLTFLKHVLLNLNNESNNRCKDMIEKENCKSRFFSMNIYSDKVYVLNIFEIENHE